MRWAAWWARYGVSTIDVISRVKDKLMAMEMGLQPGETVVTEGSFLLRAELLRNTAS